MISEDVSEFQLILKGVSGPLMTLGLTFIQIIWCNLLSLKKFYMGYSESFWQSKHTVAIVLHVPSVKKSSKSLLLHLKYIMLDITIKLVSNLLNSEYMEYDWPFLKT